MPPENPQTDNPNHEIEHFIVGNDGQSFFNKENLPLDTLISSDQFKDYDTLLRYAYDSTDNTLYIQDGKDWYTKISDGGDAGWTMLNHAIRHIRHIHGTQPNLRYGEPPNTAIERRLSQFEDAWKEIVAYANREFDGDPVDIPVVEYVPEAPNSSKVRFSPTGGNMGKVAVNGPALFVNRANIGAFGQPDYEKLNHWLTHEYLRHYSEIAPDQFKEHIAGKDELYFAIWKGQETKIYKANERQANRIIDEEALRSEPSLAGYKGPLIIFSFCPKHAQITLHNSLHKNLEKFEQTNHMFQDLKRKIAKAKGVREGQIVVSHDTVASGPYTTKLSKQTVLWDFIQDVLAPKIGLEQIQDIAIIESPLTTDGSIKSFLVRSVEDEQQIPAERELRIRHGLKMSYPYIAVESRIKSVGMKYHEILREYAKVYPQLQNIHLIQHAFDESPDSKPRHVTADESQMIHLSMRYMLEMGLDNKAVLDFFAPRTDLRQRAIYAKTLDEENEKFSEQKTKRHMINSIPKDLRKLASIDLGINDWYWITLQEGINDAQHVNNQQSPSPGGQFNLKEKKNPMILQGPKTTEGLLNKKHDAELGYMKSTEQLLRESQI